MAGAIHRNLGKVATVPPLSKETVNNILALFTSVLVICILAVLAFVLIWHYHIQALDFSPRVAEASLTQKAICSNPELTVFASIVTLNGVVVWIVIHHRRLTWL